MFGAIIILSALVFHEPGSFQPSLPEAQRLYEADKHYRAGVEEMRRERFEEAVEEFRKAVKLDPDSFMAYFSMGKSYIQLKEYESSVRAYLSCREAWDRTAEEQMKHGFEKDVRREDQIRANEDVIRELQGMLGTVRTDVERARIQARIDEVRIGTDSMQRLRGGNRGAPQPPAEFPLALGSAYLRIGSTDLAEKAYLEALKLRPKYGEAHSNLAVICIKRGDYEGAHARVKAAEKAGFRVNPQLVSHIEDARRKSRK